MAAGFIEDLKERLRNTAQSLGSRRRKILILLAGFCGGLFCLAAAWICLDQFKHLDAESAYFLGNFPDIKNDPKWQEIQSTRRLLFPFVVLTGLAGALLAVGCPIYYWYYRND